MEKAAILESEPANFRLAETQPVILGEVSSDPNEQKTYIVVLEDPAIPSYRGGIPKYSPTDLALTGETKLVSDDSAVAAYADYLQSKQSEAQNRIQAALGRPAKVQHHYSYALNGMAMEISAAESTVISNLPGILRVELDRAYPLTTDASPDWIGATGVWDGSATGVPGTMGEGVIIGVIDTGINMDHPSFAAVGGDGYTHTNPNGAGNYLGWCDETNPNYDSAYQCNDKLIGAWDYGDWSGEDDGPEDNVGHDSHTASTAAGNIIPEATVYAPTASYSHSISGIAPHANLIAYDACIESGCRNSDIIAAVNQAIIDGVDILNESIGLGGDTFSGEKQLAYLNAVKAGIFYTRSAGNDGPGSGTIGPEPPWTFSAAALRHNRKVINSLVNLSGGTNSPSDIMGEGFTAGYGPAEIVYAAEFTETLKTGATAENARLCAMGNPNDDTFETPWEEGTFNGEIVVCDQGGGYPRLERSANLLESGAGGLVLVDDGSGVVTDGHALPGLHIYEGDGDLLKSWLDPSIIQMATITGYSFDYAPSHGDVMAVFSSRGPGDQEFIKPDGGAPGVSIWAAFADKPGEPDEGEEYGIYSGTSMASPHIAGAAALVKAAHPTWSPSEIKSALMTTAIKSTLKEDGSTPTDPFDTGSGRIQVDRAVKAGLLFDIDPASYAAADVSNASDLNLPSLAENNCYTSCSWTRTVRNALGTTETWQASTESQEGVHITVDPASFTLPDGGSQPLTITVTMSDTIMEEWRFGTVTLSPDDTQVPETHFPLAVYPSRGNNLAVLEKTVDKAQADTGEILDYTLTINNPKTKEVTYSMTDTVPAFTHYLDGSAFGGLSYNPSQETLTWQQTMDPASVEIRGILSSQFRSLSSYGVEPFDFPSNRDEGGLLIGGLDFWYLGEHYSEVIWSVNGTLEVGAESGLATGGTNQTMPDSAMPNNLLAPWWGDIDFNDGGTWSVAQIIGLISDFYVFEWNGAPKAGTDGDLTATFQIWIRKGSDLIRFVYGPFVDYIDEVNEENNLYWTTATIGVEDLDGLAGDQQYYNGLLEDRPAENDRFGVVYSLPDPITLGFSVLVDDIPEVIIVNEALVTDQYGSQYGSRALTRVNPWEKIFLPFILR